MSERTITSVQNPRVKDAVRLRDARHRQKQGRFLIDGSRELLRAIEGGIELAEVFVCEPSCHTPESREILSRLDELTASVWQVTPEVFEKLSFGQRQEGVLAVARTPSAALAQFDVAADGVLAVIEGVEKPGNVGAVLRSADGAGLAGVIVANPATDLFNPNCIRASLGTIFTRPVAQAASADVLRWLRERGYRMFAARVDATRLYSEVDYRGPAAIVLGSEAEGLSAEWHAADITPIKLPMRGQADSLNVSATAAVLFYEALRQRAAQAE